MSTLDVVGILCTVGAGQLVAWIAMRRLRRLHEGLRDQNLTLVAALFGPRRMLFQSIPPGRWHKVVRESHEAAAIDDAGRYELHTQLLLVDHLGRRWACKLRCDDLGRADQPMLRQLPSSTMSWTL